MEDQEDTQFNRRRSDNESVVIKVIKEVVYIILGVVAIVSGYISVHDRILLNSVNVEKVQEADERALKRILELEALIESYKEETEHDFKDIEYRLNTITRNIKK